MKLFFSEYQPKYDQYLFPYQVWLLKEGEGIDKIYGAGFLPLRHKKDVFYLTRSLRVDLARFQLSSENKRILRKTEGFKFQLLTLSQFNYTPSVQKFCKNFFDQRFGKGKITVAGIKAIFKSGVFSHIFVWSDSVSREAGYALCLIGENFLHYAHVFYDPAHFQTSLGARMMLESVVWAKDNQKRFAYLGTCYEKNAFYKLEFTGVEFFNGFRWSSNLEELKYLVERLDERYLLLDKEYLEKFHQGDIKFVLDKYGIRVNF